MNLFRLTFLQLAAAGILLSGCGDNSKSTDPEDKSSEEVSSEESSSEDGESSETSSEDVSSSGEYDGNDITEALIEGNITEDSRLTSDIVYELKGFVYVQDGATLTIEAGTKIASEGKSALIVMPGAKINAVGTVNKPIVMTSKKAIPASGDWAGLVIFGKAPVSTSDNTQGFEANPEDIFGGDDADDNSGTMKYVRVEYAGWEVATDKELNGVTFGGVGGATKMSYVQMHEGKDDAFEWFGGNGDYTHLVATSYHDDGYDIDEGFTGSIKFGLNIMGENSDHGIEAGSKAVNPDQLTDVAFENITIVGGGKKSALLRIKNNVVGSYKNFVLFGADNASVIKLEGDVAIEKVNDGTAEYENLFSFGTYTEGEVECADAGAKAILETAIISGADFLGVDYESQGAAAAAGAVQNGDTWYAGWTTGIEPFTNDLTNVTEPVLEGTITQNSRLTADITYELKGFVYVEDGVTLVIEPGTKIASEGKSALIVERGGKLIAVGTESAPIVMTSKKATPASGDWAGVVIMGKAPVSTSDYQQGFEANPTDVFGGTVEDDNSGALKYVRIEYAGWEVATDKELNGLTFGGVGNKTSVSYVQVYEGKDDAIEWFGGTVNGSHLVVNNYHDDGYDIDEGFMGNIKYGLNIQGENSDHGIEAGSKAVQPDLITAPTFEYVTIVSGGKGSAALRIKNNVSGEYTKFVVHAKDPITSLIQLEGDVAIEKVNDGTTKFEILYDGASNMNEIIICADDDAKAAVEAMVTEVPGALNNDYTPKAQAVIDAGAGATAGTASKWWANWTANIENL
jgi:hypothetical protein